MNFNITKKTKYEKPKIKKLGSFKTATKATGTPGCIDADFSSGDVATGSFFSCE